MKENLSWAIADLQAMWCVHVPYQNRLFMQVILPLAKTHKINAYDREAVTTTLRQKLRVRFIGGFLFLVVPAAVRLDFVEASFLTLRFRHGLASDRLAPSTLMFMSRPIRRACDFHVSTQLSTHISPGAGIL